MFACRSSKLGLIYDRDRLDIFPSMTKGSNMFLMHYHLVGSEEAACTKGLKQLWRDLASVDAMKQMCDRYSCILPGSNENSTCM